MKQVEHIGIAVISLEQSVPLYERLLNTSCYKKEKVESEQVNTAFFQTGGTKIELLEAATPESAIARFIKKKGQGMHHVAFLVEDIHLEMKRMKKEGFQLLQEKPRKGADNKWVCFLHPKSAEGVLIELCQEILYSD